MIMADPTVKPIDAVLARLKRVKPSGDGWKARCPAHDDRTPSLSVGIGDEGQVLLHCHTGCDVENVVEALNLQMRDLWPESVQQDPPQIVKTVSEHRYPVRDESGRLYAFHVRIEKSNGKKTFRWLQPDEQTWNLNGYNVVDLPLYGIHDPPTTRNIIVTEGEKAADALRSIGIKAVGTVTGSSTTPSPHALEPLLEYKSVYLWPDADGNGIKHMRQIAERLDAMGHDDVRRIAWPDAPATGDAADFVEKGNTKDDLRVLAEHADFWGDDTEDPEPEPAPELRFRLIPFEEYKNRQPPPQLVRGILARESTAMLFGESGAYKSFMALDLALHVANGLDWCGYPVERGQVIYVAGEGSAGMAKRIKAWEISHGCGVGDAWMLSEAVQLPDPEEIDNVLRAIEAMNVEPALIVIDTLARSATGLDENTQKDMSSVVDGAERLQRETGAVPLMIHHTNRQGLYRGSSLLKASMDTMLEMKVEDNHPVLMSYKQKDLDHCPPIHMEIETVEVEPAKGLWPAQTSIVLTQTDLSETAGMNQNVRLAWDVLKNEFPEGTTNQKWIDQFKTKGGAERSFYRAKQYLIEKRHVVASGGTYTPN